VDGTVWADAGEGVVGGSMVLNKGLWGGRRLDLGWDVLVQGLQSSAVGIGSKTVVSVAVVRSLVGIEDIAGTGIAVRAEDADVVLLVESAVILVDFHVLSDFERVDLADENQDLVGLMCKEEAGSEPRRWLPFLLFFLLVDMGCL
jgi:hypothetical protein